MAVGTASNFQINSEIFYTKLNDVVMQNTQIFNEASGGTIRLIPARLKGNFDQQIIFSNLSGLVNRRDNTGTSTIADTALAQSALTGVKCNRRIGPVAVTMDALKKVGFSTEAASAAFGEQAGYAIAQNMANTAIAAAIGALKKISDTTYTPYYKAGDQRYITPSNLTQALYKMGDNAGRVRSWLMHSASARDLSLVTISDKVNDIFSMWVAEGSMATTLGRRVMVSDSTALKVASVGSSLEAYVGYYTLGLVEDAIVVTQSEEETIETQTVTGYENIFIRIQGENAFNVRCKGMSFTTGTANPSDAALATLGNWTQVAADDKGGPGVLLYCREK